MWQARPNIPRRIRPGEVISADFLNGLYGIAGYFEGKPFDPTQPGAPMFLGRPVLIKVDNDDYTGTGDLAWETFGGKYYGVRMAAAVSGTTNTYEAITTNDDAVFPAAIIPDMGGSNVSGLEVGDFAMAYPISTDLGTLFLIESRAQAPRKQFRITGHTTIITDRQWDYTGLIQRWNPTGTRGSRTGIWEDDPTDETVYVLRNLKEERNTAGDTYQGNSVDFGAPPFGTTAGTLAKKLKPIGGDAGTVSVVEEIKRVVSGEGSGAIPVIYFDVVNTVQEPCIE